MQQNVVYALSTDGVNHVYVGQTNEGAEKRLQRHLHSARVGTAPLYWWIRHHLQDGTSIQITVLEECDNPEALDATEKHWIFVLRERGKVLLNQTRGGSGTGFTTAGRRDPADTYDPTDKRRHWARPEYHKRMKTVMSSDAYRSKMSAIKKGKKQQPRARVSCVACRKETSIGSGLRVHLQSCRG